MASQLDQQVEFFQQQLANWQNETADDVANLWNSLFGEGVFYNWDAQERQYAIDQLAQYMPPLMQGHAAQVGANTAVWYTELAAGEPYVAEEVALDTLLPEQRVVKSVSWAINTATSATTALAQLQGTAQRMVFDAQRDTVVYNAKKEGVKYVRHCNYAGACNWCLVMATKGVVYKSATAAVAGHDNCKCMAVPVRKGSTYTPPPQVVAAEAKYIEARKQLEAEGEALTLDNIVKKMDGIDADTAAGLAPKKPATEYDKLPPATKKTVQNSYSGKKNKAKATFGEDSVELKALKDLGPSGYYELQYKDTIAAKASADAAEALAKDTTMASQWLTAEAQFNAQQAIDNATSVATQANSGIAAKAAAFTETKAAEEAALKIAAEVETPAVNLPTAEPHKPAPDFGGLAYVGEAGGSHGAAKYTAPTGKMYVVKKQKHYKNLLDVSTADLQLKTGLHAPNAWVGKVDGYEASVQEYLPGGNAFKAEIVDIAKVSAADLLTLQKNQVYDWLISNHDTHAQQWVRDASGALVGIDKGQAFKWMGKDKLAWDFHPNKETGEHEPIYNSIWSQAINGGKYDPFNPAEGELHDYIQGLMAMPDDVIRKALKPFAEAAAADDKLLANAKGFDLLKKSAAPANDVDAFLDLVVARKNNLQNDFDALWASYKAAKTGINPMASPAPSVTAPIVPAYDVTYAIKAQKMQVGEYIVAAHGAAKQGAHAVAESYMDAAVKVYEMPVETWVKSQLSLSPPNTPAAQALLDYQVEAADKLMELLDQGTVDAYSLGKAGHIAGVTAQKFNITLSKTPADFPNAVEATTTAAKPPLLASPADYYKLPPNEKKTVQNSYSGKKNKAKAKFGESSPEYQQLKAMGPDGYYANVYSSNKPAAQAPVATAAQPELAQWEKDLLAQATAPTGPPKIVEPVLVTDLAKNYSLLSAADLTKVGNQFSGKKFKAKKATDPKGKAIAWAYGNWTKKDFWAAQQLEKGNYPHPYKDLDPNQLSDLQAAEYKQVKDIDDAWLAANPGEPAKNSPVFGVSHLLKWSNANEYKQYLLDNGMTSMLGSPISTTSKLPGVKVSAAPAPINPPTDPLKLMKISNMADAYYTAKPGGTGFNPVKAYDPNGTLKTNIEAFNNDVGVGYLTDDQLYVVLVKLPKTQQTKYLKSYADAKGQAAADALNNKLNPQGSASLLSPPTSAGSKPASAQNGADWKAGVTIKPGTQYTPLRDNNPLVVKSLANKQGVNLAIPDANAPVGSSANPHVFNPEDKEYQTFGALHTNQVQSDWDPSLYKPIGAYTGSSYGDYNEKLRVSLAKMVDDWLDPVTGKPKKDANGKDLPKPKPTPTIQKFDKAFEAETTKPTEEWMILSRSTSRREFSDNDVEGLAPFTSGGQHGTVEELKVLEGHTYIQRGIGSTSLSSKPAGMSGKHVRVIYRMPPGTKMVYVDGNPGYGYNRLTSVSGEREVLLPRDSRYKVLEVRESTAKSNGYNIDVVVELVEQEAL